MRYFNKEAWWRRTGLVFALTMGVALLLVSAACTSADDGTSAEEPSDEQAAVSQPVDLAYLPNPSVPSPINRTSPELVKVDLEIQELDARLDDGTAFNYWTFGGTVPGDFIRVREGDTIELTLSNPTTSKSTHNIDLHAVTGPGGGATLTSVNPGEVKTFKFKAQSPGLFVYHCATPIIPQHITQGMYGLILVEPEEGLPAVDHEFYVMQGEVYTKADRGDKGLQSFDLDEMLSENPDYVVMNGAVGALTGDRALKAEVGDTVRIYFGVGGPNLTSSFHVIGEIFDRVYPEAALANPLANVQTTLVPTGGATMVEFTVDVPGNYILVDHSLGRLMKGAVGILTVDGPEAPEIFSPVE